MKFILGGRDQERYPGFNGIFTKILYSNEKGAFVDDIENYNEILKKVIPRPSEFMKDFNSYEIVGS